MVSVRLRVILFITVFFCCLCYFVLSYNKFVILLQANAERIIGTFVSLVQI